MNESTKYPGHRNLARHLFYWCSAILLVASFVGCGGVVGLGPPQPPPPSVTISVSPAAVTMLLGEPQTFTATVNNATNTGVRWSVNGNPGGNSEVGTIDAAGVYFSPIILPTSGTVTVTATSVADPSKSAAALVHVNSDISVLVSPQAVPVELGASQTFLATVTSAGNPNLNVAWSVSGSGCTGSACGTVDTFGNYTAPQNIFAPPSVSLTATSIADPSKSASTTITITSSFTMSLTGPNSVGTGTTVNYAALVSPIPNSNPSRTVAWSVSGTGCSGPACGTISANGSYNAPQTPPTPATVQITATPTADHSKAASVLVTIFATLTVTVTPTSATLAPGTIQAFHAQVTGAQDTTVTWDVSGVVGGNSVLGTILNSQTTPNDTTYTAPQQIPPGGSVTVRASSNANPNISAYAIVTFATGVNVTLTPATVTRVTGHVQTFTVQVNNTPNQNISWSVSGIAGGNSTVGHICAAGSNPCRQISFDNTGSVDYLAPTGVPFPNPVTVTATSQADSTVSSSANVTILPHLAVSVLPGNATVANGGELQFASTVVGSGNQQVLWAISGNGCAAAGACGSIDASGLYTAPAVPPNPNLLNVIAASMEDSTQSATALVMISGGPNISMLAPSSAYAGSAGGFTLAVSGNNIIPSSPGPGSAILVAGTSRSTSCASNSLCTTSLNSADVGVAGVLSVQVQNPGGTLSNSENFVVLALGSSTNAIIPLTPSAPSATGMDIVVVDLSTNGGANASGGANLSIGAIGPYSIGSNSCVLGDSPVILLRPAIGISTADLCAFSVSGLDPSFTYTVSGPSVPDIIVANREPLGFGILHLKLQIPATAVTGPRTLFVENPSKDKAAATGALEVR